MKRLLGILIVIGCVGFLAYYALLWAKVEKQDLARQVAVNNNFTFVKNYLIKHFKWNYPVPSWNLILLDKTKMMIHLSDRNIPLSKIKNLYAIQATTCDILKNDKEFQARNYDEIHSIKSWNKLIFKRCFTYSVTADRKNFQIGTILKQNGKIVAKLDGTIKDSITRSYSSPRLVKNNSAIDLPYADKLSPVVIIHNMWSSKLLVKVTNKLLWETKKLRLHEWVNYLLSDIGKYDIKIYGVLTDPRTKVDFVDVDGDLVHLKGSDKKHLLNFEIRDYELKGKKKDYLLETGKFLAEVLKLAPDTDMTVSHKWTTLVIRGTKFTVDANDDSFDTFLTLWHIVELLNWQKIDITLDKAFSMIKNSKLVQDLEKARKLVSFSIFADVVNNPKWNYNVETFALTSVLTWLPTVKRFAVKYDNGQKVLLLKMKLSSGSDKFDKVLKNNRRYFGLENIMNKIKADNWKGADRLYKQLIDQVCKSTNSGKWLDVSKLWYLLDTTDTVWKLSLKDKIANDLGLTDKFVILTSRHYNWQNSVVLGYDSNDKLWVRTINLKSLNYDDNINTVVFACDATN